MRKRIRLVAVLALAALLLGGCGTPMHELTEEEEGLIVQYAAYALAKQNIYQKDGMTDAVLSEETDVPGETEENSLSEDDQSSKGDEESGAVSIAKAVGMEGKLEISYAGSNITNTYQEGTYFSVNASENKKLLIMEFKLKNTSGSTLKLDAASSGGVFSCSVDGSKQISEKRTFGEKILSGYSGSIKAKSSQKAYLIFEIPEEMAKNYKTSDLFVTVDGQTYPVNL